MYMYIVLVEILWSTLFCKFSTQVHTIKRICTVYSSPSPSLFLPPPPSLPPSLPPSPLSSLSPFLPPPPLPPSPSLPPPPSLPPLSFFLTYMLIVRPILQ